MGSRASTLTAAAGEHFIAFRLSAMDYPVALTRAGSPTVDMMVGNLTGSETVSLQVKTSSGAWRERKRKPEESHWEWTVGKGAMDLKGKSVFYVFVDLKWADNELVTPDVFIVPSETVAAAFSDLTWSMYVFWIMQHEKDKYHERWDLITNRLDR